VDVVVVRRTLRVVDPAGLEHLAVHADRRERRLELMAHGRDEVLLLAREPDLPDGEAVYQQEPGDEDGREHDRGPGEQRGAGAARRREALDEEPELELAERRRETRALQHESARRARRVETCRGARELRERGRAAKDDERGRVGEAAAPIRRSDDAFEKRSLLDEKALDVTPAVAPRVAKEHEVPR